MVLTQDHVFGNREILDHTVTHPFLGDIGEATICDITGRTVGHIPAFQNYLTLCDPAQTCDRFRQFALTVPRHACDPENFTGA